MMARAFCSVLNGAVSFYTWLMTTHTRHSVTREPPQVAARLGAPSRELTSRLRRPSRTGATLRGETQTQALGHLPARLRGRPSPARRPRQAAPPRPEGLRPSQARSCASTRPSTPDGATSAPKPRALQPPSTRASRRTRSAQPWKAATRCIRSTKRRRRHAFGRGGTTFSRRTTRPLGQRRAQMRLVIYPAANIRRTSVRWSTPSCITFKIHEN